MREWLIAVHKLRVVCKKEVIAVHLVSAVCEREWLVYNLPRSGMKERGW